MNKKYKIMNQRPQASDEEIKDFMDFHSVLTQHDHQIKIIKRTSLIKKIAVSSVVLIAVGVIYWFIQTKEQQPATHQAQEQTKNEVIVAPDEKNEQPQSVTEKTEQPVQSSAKEKPQADVQKKDDSKPERESRLPVIEEERPAEESYVQAEPVKGYPELYDYFAKNLIYPKEALKDSIQGVSTVSFIINKDGRPAKVQVTNSLGPAFDKEIARLIESMPEWKPALLNGKPVPSKISLPITFQVQKVEGK
jgi:TonB family protein